MNAGVEADLKKDDLLLGVSDVETGLLLRFSSRCLMLFLYILNHTTLCYWYVAVYILDIVVYLGNIRYFN